jgi:hypothetical protein
MKLFKDYFRKDVVVCTRTKTYQIKNDSSLLRCWYSGCREVAIKIFYTHTLSLHSESINAVKEFKFKIFYKIIVLISNTVLWKENLTISGDFFKITDCLTANTARSALLNRYNDLIEVISNQNYIQTLLQSLFKNCHEQGL